MTNTRNTPVEALEQALAVRVRSYRLREGSGGAGKFQGGEGIQRTYEFLVPARLTLNTERRINAPYGLQGGKPGACGRNVLVHNGQEHPISGKFTGEVTPGDLLIVETPGGGGWGIISNQAD